MNWISKLFGWKTIKTSRAGLHALVESIIDEETAHIEALLVAARLRVAKYDGMGRLSHTQEMLRAQAVAQVECYSKIASKSFREILAAKIVAEILA